MRFLIIVLGAIGFGLGAAKSAYDFYQDWHQTTVKRAEALKAAVAALPKTPPLNVAKFVNNPIVGSWYGVNDNVEATIGVVEQQDTDAVGKDNKTVSIASFCVLGARNSPFYVSLDHGGNNYYFGLSYCSEHRACLSEIPAVVMLEEDNTLHLVIARDAGYTDILYEMRFSRTRQQRTPYVAILSTLVVASIFYWVTRSGPAPPQTPRQRKRQPAKPKSKRP